MPSYFLFFENPNPAPRSSTQSNDGAKDADAPDALSHDTSDDTSNDGSSSPPDPGASSDVNKKYSDEGNVNDASHNLHSQRVDGNTSDRGTGSNINGSDDNGSGDNGSEGNGSKGNGSIDHDSDDTPPARIFRKGSWLNGSIDVGITRMENIRNVTQLEMVGCRLG